jgi:histidinol-phosphatase
MNQPSFKDLLAVAGEAAYLGGKRALAYFDAQVDVDYKGDNTPVTRADKEAEVVIREHLGRYFPSHQIVGEEHGTTAGDPKYQWYVDPIDGTKSFIHGAPLWGVVIGCVVEQQPHVGAVYLAGLDEMYLAATGLGATRNGRVCKSSGVSKLSESTLLAGSITRAIKRSNAYSTLADQVRLNRGWGDVFGYMLVASGRAEIMLDPTINVYDIAGVAPIVREAGAYFGTWAGESTIHGKDSMACAQGVLNDVLAVTSKG